MSTAFSLDRERWETPARTLSIAPVLRRVLIADPDEPMLGRLAPPLELAGYVVETVATGRALLSALRRQPTRLVAVAADLPDMGGTIVIQKMREVCATPPIILIATRGADPRRNPQRQDVAAILFKPVDPTAFLGVCQRVLHFSAQKSRGERRVETRRPLRVAVTVETADTTLPATLIELSAGGFRLELPTPLPLHQRVRVRIGAAKGPCFEARIEWLTPQASLTLAGGPVVALSEEDDRILSALIDPLT